MNTNYFFALAGNIGVGKTTWTQLLSDRFDWRPYYEKVVENPYLADFYQDMKRWSFHSQIFFLTQRFKAHLEIQRMTSTCIQDRTIFEDGDVFAKNLFANETMSEKDYQNYKDLYETIIDSLRFPDLIIYLRASTWTLISRIRKRGRTAIASGKKAAISIDLYLRGCTYDDVFSKIRVGNKGTLSMEAYLSGRDGGNWSEPKDVISYPQLNTLYFEHSKRIEMCKLDRNKALKGFSEVNLGLTSDEARSSSSRCFSCGTCNYCYNCYFFCPEGAISLNPLHQIKTVDLDHCKGCGTCAKVCPRSVVEMKELGR